VPFWIAASAARLALLRLLYVVVVVIGFSPVAEDDTQALVFGTVQWNSVGCACVMLWLNAVAHHPDKVMPEGARRCRISADRHASVRLN
jgi:hypothetical protein